jgi:hypothetical protein
LNATPNTAPQSLPACAKNHPGVESVIEVRICTRIGAAPYKRARCTVCAEIAAKRGQQASSAVEGYGVVRLDWVPPEMVLAAISQIGAET